ncbi:MAG: deoxyguanosinetriphosphate triphosphohydrolase [Gammaproteobacteria bacterium]|nr:deoxyguanosinetriphosphate triphosphohydrolase [Gammaproteobacteria bacterium]
MTQNAHLVLAPYACSDATSRGQLHDEHAPSHRTLYQRDRDRIIHSAAFRRLEYKTQVFVNHEGDLFRTRLTHSIEVAQIARSIARELRLNEDLTEAIALSHDLGHTPFGHAGQTALNKCMQDYGGFEHNLQSLRIVDSLEERYADYKGINLTFESREGILKHCSLKNARKLGDVGQRFLDNTQPSLEAQLTNLADEIAYSNHDIDDGLRYGLLSFEEMMEATLFRQQYEHVIKKYPHQNQRILTHEIIRRMISHMVVDLIENSRKNILEAGPQSPDDVRQQSRALIAFSDELQQQASELKQFMFKTLYRHYRVHRMSRKASQTISALFDVFIKDLRILPPDAQAHCHALFEKEGENGNIRGISDYIAGMTDRFAIVEYERIFNPRQLSMINLIP